MATLTEINIDALAGFLEVWSGDLADDLATKLTCGEVDALARLLHDHGRHAAAAAWINIHSRADEEDDEHERTPCAAIMFELDHLTATYPELLQTFEDPDTFGAGHIVLSTPDDLHRFAITERCDKPADDDTREPIGWHWEIAHRTGPSAWHVDQVGECPADNLDELTRAAWPWAAAHGGNRGQ